MGVVLPLLSSELALGGRGAPPVGDVLAGQVEMPEPPAEAGFSPILSALLPAPQAPAPTRRLDPSEWAVLDQMHSRLRHAYNRAAELNTRKALWQARTVGAPRIGGRLQRRSFSTAEAAQLIPAAQAMAWAQAAQDPEVLRAQMTLQNLYRGSAPLRPWWPGAPRWHGRPFYTEQMDPAQQPGFQGVAGPGSGMPGPAAFGSASPATRMPTREAMLAAAGVGTDMSVLGWKPPFIENPRPLFLGPTEAAMMGLGHEALPAQLAAAAAANPLLAAIAAKRGQEGRAAFGASAMADMLAAADDQALRRDLLLLYTQAGLQPHGVPFPGTTDALVAGQLQDPAHAAQAALPIVQ